VAVLTGTLLGGYADDLFNILFRLEPRSMVREGFEWARVGCADSWKPMECWKRSPSSSRRRTPAPRLV
jgi:hypothetical protein